MDEAHKILKSTFGYPGFRGVQQKVRAASPGV